MATDTLSKSAEAKATEVKLAEAKAIEAKAVEARNLEAKQQAKLDADWSKPLDHTTVDHTMIDHNRNIAYDHNDLNYDSKTDPNNVNYDPNYIKPAIIPKKEFKIIDNAQYDTLVKDEYLYPFADLTIGQAFFVPLEPNDTIDKLVFATNKQANRFRVQNSSIEKNEDGDEILENVTVRARLRNQDGSFKLDSDGNPKLSATQLSRPKMIGPMFIVKAVINGDAIGDNDVKADADGVLVIRVD